jgi:hypothetical protein
MTTVDDHGRPQDSILTDATVIIMNRGLTPASGQGLLAISPKGCFYIESGDDVCRTISLDELDIYIKRFPCKTEDQRKIVAIIQSTIATCRNGNNPS